jgi:hypothetical protein
MAGHPISGNDTAGGRPLVLLKSLKLKHTTNLRFGFGIVSSEAQQKANCKKRKTQCLEIDQRRL